MAPAKKELTRTQKSIALITVTALAVYSIISIALVANAYSQLNSNVDELGDIVDNWQLGSIQDIKVAATCPAGYESALTDRVWAGINAGCWCGNVASATLSAKNITCAPFCEGTCSATAASVGCNDVAPKAAQMLNFYGTTVTGGVTNYMQLCLKRSTETWASTAFISTGACPAGYKSCMTGDNKFCTKEATCPITSITVTTSTTGAGVTCGTSTNCAIIAGTNLINTKKIEWTREELDALPLAQFTLNEYSMCRIKSTNNVTPNRKYFYLYANKTTTCGYEGASRWTQSDTISEADLFTANKLNTYITSTLSTFTESGMSGYYPTGTTGNTFNYGLYTRRYIPFKATCRNRLENLVSKRTFVDGVRTAQLALLVISIVSVLFLGLPLAWMEIQNLRGVDLSCIDGKGEEERKKLKKIKKMIGYIFKGLQLPFQLWAIVYCGSVKGLLLDISDEACSNVETNAVLIFIAATLNKTYSSTLTAIGILAASLLVDIILDVWERRKAKKDAEKQKSAISPGTNKDEKLELANLEEGASISPLKFGQASPVPQSNSTSPQLPAQPQVQPPVYQQPQAPAQQGPSIVIQLQPGQMGMPQQQYPPQGYPPQQYPPQQYPPQQYPPQQYPQQGYPQPGYPQQQYPPRY